MAMEYEPLHPFVIDIADRVAAIDNRACSGMMRFSLVMDVIIDIKVCSEKYWLSDNDLKVIFAIINRSMRRI